MALRMYRETGNGRSCCSRVGGTDSTALTATSRISSATRRLNRTLLNDAIPPVIPMMATSAHEMTQITSLFVRLPTSMPDR